MAQNISNKEGEMGGTLKDIRSLAIQMETDGIKFYTDLANKTFHPMGKAMFRSFAEDEKLHAKRLKALLSAPEAPAKSQGKKEESPQIRLVTVFRKMGEELKGKTIAGANDIDAVKLAMEAEEKGIVFYEKAAKEAGGPKEREIYTFLAGEEKTHLGILQNTLDYLKNTELWEAESEGRIYDMWIDMIHKRI
jgi:rubrerythrin